MLFTLLWPIRSQAADSLMFSEDFRDTAQGENVSWNAGDIVEAVVSDDHAYISYTLSSGSATMVKVPLSMLDPITVPQKSATEADDAEETESPTPSPPPISKATATPEENPNATDHLTLLDGTQVAGMIIRAEERMVVLMHEDKTVSDIPITQLDDTSADHAKQWKKDHKNDPPLLDPRVIPGETISLELGDIGASNQSDPARFTVRIPETYSPDKPVPLILFLRGGGGSDNCDGAKSFVDSSKYVLVAFPYSQKYPSPKKAIDADQSEKLIEFQKPMLERLQALIPNTNPDHRVVVGSSNGAHMIAVGVCDGWSDFLDYFSTFVLHEGGSCESHKYSKFRRKEVYVLMGSKSEALGFAEWVAKEMKQARVRPDIFVAEGEGHGMGNASKEAIRKWIGDLYAKLD
jgi:hypothetical protein